MEINKVEIRNLRIEDYSSLKIAMQSAYNDMENSYWKEKHIKLLLKKFPEGQKVVFVNDQLAGCALSILIDYELAERDHTYLEITDNYKFGTHNPIGNVMYGIDVFIIPEFRGLRLGRRMYDERKEICEQMNLKGIIFGGRIPNYSKFSDTLTPKEYIDKVKLKDYF